MTDLLDQIKQLIRDSKLSTSERVDLYEILFSLPEQEKPDTYEYLVEHPEMINKIVENFKKKKEIIAKQDKPAWQKLLKEEEKELEAVAKQAVK